MGPSALASRVPLLCCEGRARWTDTPPLSRTVRCPALSPAVSARSRLHLLAQPCLLSVPDAACPPLHPAPCSSASFASRGLCSDHTELSHVLHKLDQAVVSLGISVCRRLFRFLFFSLFSVSFFLPSCGLLNTFLEFHFDPSVCLHWLLCLSVGSPWVAALGGFHTPDPAGSPGQSPCLSEWGASPRLLQPPPPTFRDVAAHFLPREGAHLCYNFIFNPHT